MIDGLADQHSSGWTATDGTYYREITGMLGVSHVRVFGSADGWPPPPAEASLPAGGDDEPQRSRLVVIAPAVETSSGPGLPMPPRQSWVRSGLEMFTPSRPVSLGDILSAAKRTRR